MLEREDSLLEIQASKYLVLLRHTLRGLRVLTLENKSYCTNHNDKQMPLESGNYTGPYRPVKLDPS